MQQTYEETRVKKDDAWAKYMKEGADVQLVTWNGKVISVDPPNTVELAIAETEPGVKGTTVSGGTKPAVLETGAVVMVRGGGDAEVGKELGGSLGVSSCHALE